MAGQWTEEELAACVRAYLDMMARHTRGEKVNKKALYQQLAGTFGRSVKSYEYRMQNISHVLNLMGRDWVPGLKPAKNVGNKVASILERQIHTLEGRDPTAEKLTIPSNGVVSDFERDEAGNLKWWLPNGVEEADVAFTGEDLAELDRQATQGNHVLTPSDAPKGSISPLQTPTTRIEFARDPAVVAWVLGRAVGKCEACERPAPFTRKDGSPFLEVHHLRQLAELGTDRISNAIAVCPNCHRELHFGSGAGELLDRIYGRLTDLIRE